MKQHFRIYISFDYNRGCACYTDMDCSTDFAGERTVKMVTKEELKEYYRLVCEIRELQEEIKQLQSVWQSVGATRYDIVGGSGGSGDIMGKTFARLNELTEYYAQKIEERIQQQEKIETAIEHLPIVERRLMRYRYIDGLDWVNVAARLNYSWKQTHRIHSRALQMLKSDTQ